MYRHFYIRRHKGAVAAACLLVALGFGGCQTVPKAEITSRLVNTVVDRENSRLYVKWKESPFVSVLDLESNDLIATLDLKTRAGGLLPDLPNRALYVFDAEKKIFNKVDLSDNSVAFNVSLPPRLTGSLETETQTGKPEIQRSDDGLEQIVLDKITFTEDKEGQWYNLFSKYTIAPGDVLDILFQIQTWKERQNFTLAVGQEVGVKFIHAPELNEQQLIRPDGTISLPYIGETNVTGKTVAGLTAELKKKYIGILKDPELYVIVPQFNASINELKNDLHTAPRGLSRLTTVRPDGFATFPMIGDVKVAHKTVPEVNTILNEEYSEILPGLHVDLFLEQHAGAVVYVTGEVRSPGAYPIRKPITVLEALAMAGSHLSSARLDSVMVVRDRGDKMVATRLNLKGTLGMKDGAALFCLKPDDIVYVPRRWISSASELTRNISEILFFRGWGITWDTAD